MGESLDEALVSRNYYRARGYQNEHKELYRTIHIVTKSLSTGSNNITSHSYEIMNKYTGSVRLTQEDKILLSSFEL